jgi:hypothetical protein
MFAAATGNLLFSAALQELPRSSLSSSGRNLHSTTRRPRMIGNRVELVRIGTRCTEILCKKGKGKRGKAIIGIQEFENSEKRED